MGKTLPTYDVIVVGGGPAGATAAYELATSGINVLILEKEKFPRYKPCGGGLSLKIDRVLKFSIKEVIETTVMGVHFSCQGKNGRYILSDRPIAYMVMRDRFDSLLISEATKAGAAFIDGTQVKGIFAAKWGYEVSAGNQTFNCRYIIGADGANGIVQRSLHPQVTRSVAASLETEISVDPRVVDGHNHYVHIDFGAIPSGYAWVFPKRGRFSAGIAGFKGIVKQPRRNFDKFIKGAPSLHGVDKIDHKGHPIPLFRTPQPLTKGGIILAGDAGNLVDPFFGEGIYYAVRSAQIASTVVSEAIHKGGSNLSRYDKLLAHELYPEFKAAQKISQVVYTFPMIWYDTLTERPELAEKYYNVLRGNSRYTIFLKGLATIAGSLIKSVIKRNILQLLK